MDISKYLNPQDIDYQSTQPLYVQIAGLIVHIMHKGLLLPGTKLPPERELANLFAVSRTTAINAYRHLEKQGFVHSKIGSGTYAASCQPETSTYPAVPWQQLFTAHPQNPLFSILKELVSASAVDGPISMGAGMPDPALYPLDLLNDLSAKLLPQASPSDFGHIPTEGYHPLRASLAALLSRKGISASPANIMVLSGSQQGLYLISKTFLEPGDYVITESPTYIGAIQTFQAAGAKILSLPDNPQLDLSLLEDYLIRYRPKLFYILPTFQNPTGRVLNAVARQELLRLAARHRLVIVEDDPYGELYYGQEPPPSLKSLDPYGGVLYLSTFSKILFPGLRTGWIAAPPEVIHRLALEKQYIDLHSANWIQWLLHHFLESDLLDTHLQHVRAEYRLRRDAAFQALKRYCGDSLQFSLPEGGFYFWCTLKNECSPGALLHEAARKGISFVPGEAFYAASAPQNKLRLNFTAHNPPILTEGIRRLSAAIDQASRKRLRSNQIPPSSLPII